MSSLLLCGALGQLGCESEDAKACHENYLKAHALISGVDNNAMESVQPALEAVENAIPSCKKANLNKELSELEKARKTLEGNANRLRNYVPRKELTPEELEKLIKDGDPNCPKGQSYNYRKTGKQVRCTGPQVVSFTRGQAEEYFKNRGFRLKADGSRLVAEFGPESYHYEFTGTEPTAKTRCLQVFALPGMSWEESVSRVTGVNPALLKKGATVRAADGSTWPLINTDNETQPVYTLGKCGD